MRHRVNRREFLGTAASAGAAFAAASGARSAVAADAPEWPKLQPTKIYTVFVGRTGGIYLSRPKEEVDRFKKYLAKLEKKLGDVVFSGGDMIPPAQTPKVLEQAKKCDALMLFHLSGHGGDAPTDPLNQLVGLGLPTAVFSQPFSGHGWMYFPRWEREGKKVVLLPTADWSELDRVAAIMRVGPLMRQTRIIAVGRAKGTEPACSAEAIKKRLGAELIVVNNDQIIAAHKAVPLKAAEAEAKEYWLSKAQEIVEPTRDEIINSARMFLAVRDLMIKERVQAITSSHCMGEPAKGCLTFSKLNDLGHVGACEGDMDSALTMLMFGYAFRKPGFITDPVFDTSKNALIHFHCTSATKMDGPDGDRLPFRMRTQTDSGRGVALEVANRVGQPVTCAKFVNLDTMLISKGKTFAVTRDSLGCRTQFWTEVADARAFFHNWGAGIVKGDAMTLLHRVVFYGDYMQDIKNMGVLMGFKVVEEG